MKPTTAYLALAALGTVLPLSQLVAFLREHGMNLRLFFAQLFSTPVGAFFGLDVIVSSLVLWAFVFFETRRLGMRFLWSPVVANLLVGVSLGLPLFLYLRERRLQVPEREER